MRHFGWVLGTILITFVFASPGWAQDAEPAVDIVATNPTLKDLADDLNEKFDIRFEFHGQTRQGKGKELNIDSDGLTEKQARQRFKELARTVGVRVNRNKDDVMVVRERRFKPIEFRPFLPKTRYYFDTGDDEDGEIDIFKDGTLTPAIDFVNFFLPLNLSPTGRFGRFIGDDWKLGPSLGFGITTPGDPDAEADPNDPNSESSSSNAPILMLSAAFELDIPISNKDKDGNRPDSNYISIEVGYALGISTDEEFDDINDGAIFFGLGFSWKQKELDFSKNSTDK